MPELFAVVELAQGALEFKIQVIIAPFESPVIVKIGRFVPAFDPLICH